MDLICCRIDLARLNGFLLTKNGNSTLYGSVMVRGAHIVITLAPFLSSFLNRFVSVSTRLESLNQKSKTVASEISASRMSVFIIKAFLRPTICLRALSAIDLSISIPIDFLTPNSLAAMATVLPSPQPRWQNISPFFSLAKLNIFLMTLSVSETLSPLSTDCGSDDRKSLSSNYISLHFHPLIKSKVLSHH